MNSYSGLFERLAVLGMGLIVFAILIMLVALTVYVLFLLTLSNAIRAVSPQNRKIQVGMPFLLLAPIFINPVIGALQIPFLPVIIGLATVGLQFFIFKGIADSLEAEYLMRGMAVNGKPTYNIAVAYVVINAASVLAALIPNLQLVAILGFIIVIAILVVWILYWVQVAQHKNVLKNTPAFQAGTSQIF